MVRYKLEQSIRVGYSKPSWSNDDRVEIPVYQDNYIRFVDLIEQNEDFLLVNIFLKDGLVITAWLVKKPLFPLEIHNEHELFDGRFNSYKGKS